MKPLHSIAAGLAPGLTRRQLLAAGAGAAAAAWAPPALAQAEPIRLGQSIALSGPLSELGNALHQGAQACFAHVNARGGINGRPIQLIALDDGYEVKRAVENFKTLLADPALFGLFGCFGTPIIEALLPMIRGTDTPSFSAYTGALAARPADMRNVFNVRASYPEEAARLVQHLATIGLKRVAVAHQNNAFGREVNQAADAAMRRFGLASVAVAAIDNDGSGADAAVDVIAAARPDAVLLGLAGKPTIVFVKAMRAKQRGLPLYAPSVLGSAATLSAMGDDAHGIAVSQVVPMPTLAAVPVVRDFQAAWRAIGSSLEPSHLTLEGYINARVMVEALKRAGTPLKRASFIEAAWGLRRLDLGGFEVGFDKPGGNASRFVELTLVNRGGKFIR
jgi:ABC-type branched-subunit amino acid transport system substrate-binding protein